MDKEKIRFRVDYLLLGERQFSRLLVFVPQVLKILSFGLIVLAVPQVSALYYSFPVLGVLYVSAAVMLRLLVWCAELFRDRWFMHRINGTRVSASSLLADFSFSDIFRAAVLALTLRIYCFGRGVLFFVVPALCLAVSLFFVNSGASAAVLGALMCGNLLLFAVAGLFCSAAFCTVRYAVKLSSLEKSGLFRAVKEKITALDSSGFRLLRLRVLFGGFFSAGKIMAGMVYSKSMLLQKRYLLINC